MSNWLTIKPSVTRELKLAGDGGRQRERETGRLLIFRTERECVCVCGATDRQTYRDMLSEVDSTGLQASETYVSLALYYVTGRNLHAFTWAVIKAK